jgi:hypothetical protein
MPTVQPGELIVFHVAYRLSIFFIMESGNGCAIRMVTPNEINNSVKMIFLLLINMLIGFE